MTQLSLPFSKKFLLPFILIILFLSSLIGLTTPTLLKQTHVGLEFKGGYEVLYVAQSQQPGQPVKEATVDDELGEANFHNTLKAGVLFLCLIYLFTAIAYCIPGLLAVFTLTTYVWSLLVVFNLLYISLSVGAIAAFVAGVGIASDAIILTYERIKQELQHGKTVGQATRDGKYDSLQTIVDSNAAILIGAITLFVVGSGTIRDFALTAILSILLSFMSNVLLFRLLLSLLTLSGLVNQPMFFGIKRISMPNTINILNAVKYRYVFFALSSLIALAGIVSIVTSLLNLDGNFIAQQPVERAIYAIGLAIIGIFFFVVIRFGWQYAIAACVAVMNSAFFPLWMFAIFKFEIDITFIAAILTVIIYSVNDTIIIFGRIRENFAFEEATTAEELTDLVNQSIWQILRRSIYTMLTVVTGALCLFLFGAEPIHAFALAVFYGLVCETYSSIFIAAPLWWLLKQKSLPALVEF